MGKALYNLSRTNGDPPLLLSATLATLTDQQVKQPLLCSTWWNMSNAYSFQSPIQFGSEFINAARFRPFRNAIPLLTTAIRAVAVTVRLLGW